jgi:hypothetical protein
MTDSIAARICGAGRWVRSGAAGRAAAVISAGGGVAPRAMATAMSSRPAGESPGEAAVGTRDTIKSSLKPGLVRTDPSRYEVIFFLS